jgi:hypothetical protein
VYASTWLLPDTLQHSILGLWLTATQMGFAPTCFQTISSKHVLLPNNDRDQPVRGVSYLVSATLPRTRLHRFVLAVARAQACGARPRMRLDRPTRAVPALGVDELMGSKPMGPHNPCEVNVTGGMKFKAAAEECQARKR